MNLGCDGLYYPVFSFHSLFTTSFLLVGMQSLRKGKEKGTKIDPIPTYILVKNAQKHKNSCQEKKFPQRREDYGEILWTCLYFLRFGEVDVNLGQIEKHIPELCPAHLHSNVNPYHLKSSNQIFLRPFQVARKQE